MKTIWALFASTVVLLAVIISLLKFALPYADDYKRNIESYLLERFGAKVAIGSIGASWQTSGPVIVLNSLTLTPSPEAPLDISIRETRIELDFWQSIAQQKLVTGAFLLDGIRSRINSSVFFKVRPRSEGNQLFEGLSHLFLSQIQQFKVVDSFIIVDHEEGSSQDFQIDNLTWVNQGNRHQGQGEVFVDGFSNNSLAVIVDLYGQRRDDIFGQIYLEANKIDVTPWLTQVVGQHINLSGTEANFAIWGEVQGGLVENILMDIRNSGIRWRKQEELKYLKVESAHVQWWKSNEDWLLFGNQIRLSTDKNIPGPFKFSFQQDEQASKLSLREVDLTAATQLFSLFSATKELAILADSDMAGTVDELTLHWGEALPLAGKLRVGNLAFRPSYTESQPYLGVENIDLTAYWLDSQLWLEAAGESGQLLTRDTFEQAIDYDSIHAAGWIDWSQEQFQFALPRVSFKNSEVALELTTEFNKGESSHLDLYAEVKGPTLGNVNKYLPRHLLSEDVYQYLDSAIQQGRGELTQILVSGDPTRMPYSSLSGSDEAGRFIVNADIRDAMFRFDSEWPALEELNANLRVDNSLMVIEALDGQLAHLSLNRDVQANIPLDTQSTNLHLTISPESLQLEEFHRLVNNSPLQQYVGDVFEFVQLGGDSRALVKLDIPLSGEVTGQASQEVVAEGWISTKGASLSLPEILLDFEGVDAKVHFRNDVFSVEASQARLFELPVSFEVKGGQANTGYVIDGELTALWTQKQVAELYPLPVLNHVQGEFTTALKVKVNVEDEGYQYFVDGKTDLTDASFNLSGPIKSELGEYASVDWSVIGDEMGNDLDMSLDELLFFTADIPNSKGRMERAHLSVGQDEVALPTQGFDISVNVPRLEFEPVLSFVLDIIDSLPKSEGTELGFIDSPHAIKANVQALDILGLTWNNVSLDATPQADHWLFSIGAKETLTSVKVFDDIEELGIQIDSEFLHIVTQEAAVAAKELASKKTGSNANEQEVSKSAPAQIEYLSDTDTLIASLPPISASCKTCTYNGKPLGQVEINTRTVGSKLWIDKANFSYERNYFEGQGWWQGDKTPGKTSFTGKLTSRYFGDWLQEWGVNSGIKDSDANIDLALDWLGAPHEFGFKHLNGTASIKLGEGYLSEVSDQGARYFSLFSLDSLYRYLKFDFSEVFAKGLFYNDIKGDLLIKNGVAHSDNIRMDGVAGDMKMTGHTDLNSNTLDYNVSFKPKVTANLPAIAAWAIGGPVALFAAIAVDKIVESAAVISELKLKISGELSEPKVEEVERFTRTVKLPPTKKPGPNKSQSSKPESKSNSKVPESIESIEEKGL